MTNSTKLPVNVEVKADLTESTNKVVLNTLNKPTEETGKIGGTLLSFVHNFFLFPF